MMTEHEHSSALDDAFRVLSDPLRRRLLCLLHELDRDRIPIAELTERLAATVEDESATTVRVTLHHVHLPTLVDVGYVTHNQDTGELVNQSPRIVTEILNSGIIDDCE